MQVADVISVYLLNRIWMNLKRFWWAVLAACFLAGAAGGFWSSVSYVPLYRVEALVSVSVSSDMDILSDADYYSNQSAVAYIQGAYEYFLTAEDVQGMLRTEMGGRTPAAVSMTSVAETNMFELSAQGTDPDYLIDSVNAVIQVFPRFTREIIGDSVIRIITPAAVPAEPCNTPGIGSAVLRWAGIALLVSLAALLLISVPQSLRLVSARQIGSHISAPCLTHLPLIRKQRKTGRDAQERSLLLLNGQGDKKYRDAMARLRLKITRTLRERGGNTVLVTSSLPSEGKSTVSVNLALSLAAGGKRVALIDADLRASYLKDLLGFTEESDGLCELLSQDKHSFRFLQVPGTGLHLLAGSMTVDNPAPLLRHETLSKLMDVIKRSFDYVVIDTPPCVMMADAAFFARYADTVLYVIREDYVTPNQLTVGIRGLENAYSGLCGYVLNMSNHSTASDSGTYSGDYGSSYGGYESYSDGK